MKFNKGLAREFVCFLIIYGFDFGMDVGVFFDAIQTHARYEKFFNAGEDYKLNNTAGILSCSTGPWTRKDYEKKIDHFEGIMYTYSFFICVGGLLITGFLFAYIWMLYQTTISPEFIIEKRELYVDIKFWFGFLCSMVYDIPASVLGVELYSERSGAAGLMCWECEQDMACNDKEILQDRQEKLLLLVVFNMVSFVIVSLYKGVTTFYRWSKVDNMPNLRCSDIRACAALFAGSNYAIIMLTPCSRLAQVQVFLPLHEHREYLRRGYRKLVPDRWAWLGRVLRHSFLLSLVALYHHEVMDFTYAGGWIHVRKHHF